jgi:hypothetical protein
VREWAAKLDKINENSLKIIQKMLQDEEFTTLEDIGSSELEIKSLPAYNELKIGSKAMWDAAIQKLNHSLAKEGVSPLLQANIANASANAQAAHSSAWKELVSADECLYSWLPTVSCTMERSFIWLILPL